MEFHIELRDGRGIVRAFNLSEADIHKQVIAPLRAGQVFEFKERNFDPRSARLMVIEGDHLGPGELGIGQGWTNAVKRGTDVTQRFLSETPANATTPSVNLETAGRLKERILGRVAAGPFALTDALGLTGDLLPGRRVSERIGAVEMAVWEMLHSGQLALHANPDSGPLERDQWESVVLDPDTWLAPGPDSPVISATA